MAEPMITPRAIELVADRKIREAIDAGLFNHLDGAGQPVPGMSEPRGRDHWIAHWARQQRVTATPEALLKLRPNDDTPAES